MQCVCGTVCMGRRRLWARLWKCWSLMMFLLRFSLYFIKFTHVIFILFFPFSLQFPRLFLSLPPLHWSTPYTHIVCSCPSDLIRALHSAILSISPREHCFCFFVGSFSPGMIFNEMQQPHAIAITHRRVIVQLRQYWFYGFMMPFIFPTRKTIHFIQIQAKR